MKTINLRWMYPHYRHDEFVDVTDEVWAAMYQAKREMENYERRKVYHRAYYSLDAYSWLENYALEHSRKWINTHWNVQIAKVNLNLCVQLFQRLNLSLT